MVTLAAFRPRLRLTPIGRRLRFRRRGAARGAWRAGGARLAPVAVARFRDAVKLIKSMGISILIAESNLASATAVADRLYAIDRGEIIFHGEPKDALGNEEVMKTLRG